MLVAPDPLECLTSAMMDAQTRAAAAVPAGARPLVYAMFYQVRPVAKPDGGQSSCDYCTVLWVESLGGWLVYFNGVYAYRVLPREAADVAMFLRDLRGNHLMQGPDARARYRARA